VLHGSEWFAIPEHFLWYDRLYFERAVPFYCRRADALIAVSNATRMDVIRHVGIPPQKIRTIHNGFDPKSFRRIDDAQYLRSIREKYALPEKFIIWVGQIESRKNVGGLLRAFAKISGEVPHKLVLVGEERFTFPMAAGAARDLHLIEELGLEDRVQFTGWIAHGELPAVYNLADLFAFPSLYEGFGIPLLEAMACGCPVVTANTCAPPEVTAGAAYLVDPADDESIANGMRTVLADSGLREKMVASGLVRAGEFSWAKCAREVLALFESLGPGALPRPV
jgi:glycosyltransferase involved in cell wall biosynthesis